VKNETPSKCIKPTVVVTAFERKSGFKTENLIKHWINLNP